VGQKFASVFGLQIFGIFWQYVPCLKSGIQNQCHTPFWLGSHFSAVFWESVTDST
jgi:hypothetical protein